MTYPVTGGSIGTWMDEIRAARGVNPTAHLEAGCRLTRSAAQSITSTVWTVVTWDQESYDTDGMHDLVTNPSRITIQRAGVYLVTAACVFAANATGHRRLALAVNGSREVAASASAAFDDRGRCTVALQRRFNAGEYLEALVYQTSGGALDLEASVASEGVSQMAAQYLGPSA